MPRRQTGLYTLVVRSGSHSAAVPLVASQAGRAASMARVLVVLPMLTWIGNSPVDDTGDGLPAHAAARHRRGAQPPAGGRAAGQPG